MYPSYYGPGSHEPPKQQPTKPRANKYSADVVNAAITLRSTLDMSENQSIDQITKNKSLYDLLTEVIEGEDTNT